MSDIPDDVKDFITPPFPIGTVLQNINDHNHTIDYGGGRIERPLLNKIVTIVKVEEGRIGTGKLIRIPGRLGRCYDSNQPGRSYYKRDPAKRISRRNLGKITPREKNDWKILEERLSTKGEYRPWPKARTERSPSKTPSTPRDQTGSSSATPTAGTSSST